MNQKSQAVRPMIILTDVYDDRGNLMATIVDGKKPRAKRQAPARKVPRKGKEASAG